MINDRFHLVSNFNERTFLYKGNNYLIPEDYLNELGELLLERLKQVIDFPKKYNFMIAGGAVLELLQTGKLSPDRDMDLFFPNVEEYKDFETCASISFRKNAGIEKNILITENAKKYSLQTKSYELVKFDLIKSPLPNYNMCNFDIDICKVGFIYSNSAPTKFINDVTLDKVFDGKASINKTNINFDESFKIMNRLIKYTAKGFKFSKKDIVRLLSVIYSGKDESLIERSNIELVAKKFGADYNYLLSSSEVVTTNNDIFSLSDDLPF